MAIRIVQEDGKRHFEPDTFAEWVELFIMGVPVKAPPGIKGFRPAPVIKKLPPLPQNPENFDTFDELMAWDRRRYAKFIASQDAPKRSSRRKQVAGNSAVSDRRGTDNQENDKLPPDGT